MTTDDDLEVDEDSKVLDCVSLFVLSLHFRDPLPHLPRTSHPLFLNLLVIAKSMVSFSLELFARFRSLKMARSK